MQKNFKNMVIITSLLLTAGSINANQLTRANGAPIGDNLNSETAGPLGPTLLQDHLLVEKLAHFDRERIPERVVHARGAAAKGYFEATTDLTDITRTDKLCI